MLKLLYHNFTLTVKKLFSTRRIGLRRSLIIYNSKNNIKVKVQSTKYFVVDI